MLSRQLNRQLNHQRNHRPDWRSYQLEDRRQSRHRRRLQRIAHRVVRVSAALARDQIFRLSRLACGSGAEWHQGRSFVRVALPRGVAQTVREAERTIWEWNLMAAGLRAHELHSQRVAVP